MTLTRHELPNGWADLRETGAVTERLRRPIKLLQARVASLPAMRDAVASAMRSGVVDAESMRQLDSDASAAIASSMGEALPLMEEMNDALVVSRVVEWSYGAPVTADGLLDLPAADYDALRVLCADTSGLAPDLDVSPDPNSPTPPLAV